MICSYQSTLCCLVLRFDSICCVVTKGMANQPRYSGAVGEIWHMIQNHPGVTQTVKIAIVISKSLRLRYTQQWTYLKTPKMGVEFVASLV